MDKAAGFRTKTGEFVTMSYFSANVMGTEAAGFVGHTHFRHPLSPGNRALSSFGKPLPYFPLHTSFLDKFKDEAHGPHQVPQSFSLEISQLGWGCWQLCSLSYVRAHLQNRDQKGQAGMNREQGVWDSAPGDAPRAAGSRPWGLVSHRISFLVNSFRVFCTLTPPPKFPFS